MSQRVESYAHVFDGSDLSIGQLVHLADHPVRCALSPEARSRVQLGRLIVENALAAGAPIYGTNTGIGSQKDIDVPRDDLAEFARRMIVGEATNFPGPKFDERVVRCALLILIGKLATGRSGVRIELIDALLELLAAAHLPTVRRHSAFGGADLTPLSQLSLAIIGRSLEDLTPPASITRLAPKESVSLIDNNSFGLGAAAWTLSEAERLLMAFDLAAAVSCEGFRAGLDPHSEVASGRRSSYGMSRVQGALRRFLADSSLNSPGESRLLQDPLSFRGITQIHGAAHEVWLWACSQVQAEINAATDNPLIDLTRRCLRTSASMISVLPVLALDCLRQSLAKVAVTSNERGLKLQSPTFAGVPVGLAEPGAPDGGILAINLNYIGSARLGELSAAAQPVLLHYVGHTADGVEDVTTLLPLAVEQTDRLIERAWELAALEMCTGVWALARRELPMAALGCGARYVFERLIGFLHIGEEGERIFDMSPIIAAIREREFVEAAYRTADRASMARD